MIEHLSNHTDLERVVLVSVKTPEVTELQVDEYLDELAFLAETAGAEPIKRFVQRLGMPDTKTFVGKGKLEEIQAYIKENDVATVIFDDELSPSQLRNIENTLQCLILDRTNLILDIFARRARSAHAKTQVELAQYNYLLPRLTRMWTHLERQRGGIGMRGPGEKEIETDRRIIRTMISKLKEDLKKIDRQMMTQRQNRGKLVRVALVGYTNVGKSTLMNVLSKSEVFAENKLFATLDTTVRKVVVDNIPFLLADTVGFIRKLPHHLVESFKSTLDEVREADILLHVVDVSHKGFEQQIEVVNQTLHELGQSQKPTLLVFNKVDAFSYVRKDDDDLSEKVKINFSLDEIKQTWIGKQADKCVFISALNKVNFVEFKQMVYNEVKTIHAQRFPFNDYLYDTDQEFDNEEE